MKPKVNRAGATDKSMTFDRCGTPREALAPLLPYIDARWCIWECAAGEDLIVDELRRYHLRVVGSDILNDPIENFFTYQPAQWDAIITNPPYSIKEQWTTRCCELGKPFALLVPVETIGSQWCWKLMQHYNLEILLLSRRVNFKMPQKGFSDGAWKSSAQFPVLWLCRNMLGTQIAYGDVPKQTHHASQQLALSGLEL